MRRKLCSEKSDEPSGKKRKVVPLLRPRYCCLDGNAGGYMHNLKSHWKTKKHIDAKRVKFVVDDKELDGGLPMDELLSEAAETIYIENNLDVQIFR